MSTWLVVALCAIAVWFTLVVIAACLRNRSRWDDTGESGWDVLFDVLTFAWLLNLSDHDHDWHDIDL